MTKKATPMNDEELTELRRSSWPVDSNPHRVVDRLLATVDALRTALRDAEDREQPPLLCTGTFSTPVDLARDAHEMTGTCGICSQVVATVHTPSHGTICDTHPRAPKVAP